MAYEQKEGSGALFKNDKKTEGSNQPDYRGDANIDGVVREVAAWIKQGSNGKSFMSLSFKVKEDYKPKKEYAASNPFDDADLDVPF